MTRALCIRGERYEAGVEIDCEAMLAFELLCSSRAVLADPAHSSAAIAEEVRATTNKVVAAAERSSREASPWIPLGGKV